MNNRGSMERGQISDSGMPSAEADSV